MVVILAGYEADMDRMLRVNAGLRSRFTEKILFQDFSPDIVLQLLLQGLKTKRLTLTAGLGERVLLDFAASVCTIPGFRSEEHTSELQSLMRLSYAVFCLKKKN